MDEKATAYQMEMIRKQIVVFEDMGLPVFATGDYNTDEGSAVYQLMLKQESIGDAKSEAAETMSMGTYPHYGDNDVTTQKPALTPKANCRKIKMSDVVSLTPATSCAVSVWPTMAASLIV